MGTATHGRNESPDDNENAHPRKWFTILEPVEFESQRFN